MNLLPQIHAHTFHRSLKTGRTRPMIFTCGTDDGDPQQYVVKSHAQLGSGSIKELIAATLGRHLQIPIPSAAVINIDPRFTQLSPELAQVLGESQGPHFGSCFQEGGNTPFSGGYGISADLLNAAFDIFAWDMFIQNPDRRRDNPNLFINSGQFFAFDHELALSFEMLIGAPPPPWELRGNKLATDHVLYIPLKAKATEDSFEPFLGRMAGVTDDELQELTESIPREWDSPSLVTKIVEHIVLVRENIDRFRRGLLEVMA